MTTAQQTRRNVLATITFAGGSLVLGARIQAGAAPPDENEREVTAAEDLMREHGVLRRALIVYRESVPRLRRDPASLSPEALNRTAQLFRSFGEDYHERRLEEPFIFPVVRQAGGPAAALPDILQRQHSRGREITEYILIVTSKGRIGTGDAGPMAQAMDAMVRMYEPHAAFEDTLVFPAWKAALSDSQYKEMGERFEEIEKQQFGHDGFEDAVNQIGDIERMLGLADLAQYTAPPPPSR